MNAIFVSHPRISETQPYNVAMHPGGRPTTHERSTLGKRLTEARERAGISQVELARQLDTNQQTVAYWERKAVSLRSDVIIKLTEILDVSADELLGTGKRKRRTATRPAGKAGQLFEALSQLPRRQQERILATVEDMIVAQNTKKAS